jgi:hypothetical protein
VVQVEQVAGVGALVLQQAVEHLAHHTEPVVEADFQLLQAIRHTLAAAVGVAETEVLS